MKKSINLYEIQGQINKCISLLDTQDANVDEALQELRIIQQKLQIRGPVLLVDEDQDLLELLYEALRDYGFDVLTARSGEDALQLSAQYRELGVPFCVAVVGLLKAKGKSTMEILPELRKDNPQLKVILSSGNLTEAAVVISEFQHFWNHLPKPYSIGKMCNLVARAVQN